MIEENLISCVVCYDKAEVHHVKTRKAHPEFTDTEWNKMPLCRRHHTECHYVGLNRFARENKSVHEWLKLNGWTICDFNNKWIHE